MRIVGVALALGSGASFIAAVALPYSPEGPAVVPPAAAGAAPPLVPPASRPADDDRESWFAARLRVDAAR